jgi:hypothetical protein
MRRLALLLWAVAAPVVAATFTVTNIGDSGPGSLRQAILDANAASDADTIVFAIPGPGVHTITPASLLPSIGRPVLIDGYTQPGSSPNTNATGELNTVLQIEIDGTAAPQRCVTIAGSDVTVRGLVVNRCNAAFELFNPIFGSPTGVVIAGNFIGTDPTGLSASPNQEGVYLSTQGGTLEITIGGPNPADRNLISGNSHAGISIGSNFNGGGSETIQGNIIGLDKNAALPVPNEHFAIILSGLGPGTTTIGGTTPELANIIAGNTQIGFAMTNDAHTATIRGNSIYDNGASGLRLNNAADLNAPLANDEGDVDGGPNGRQNYPIVSSAEPAPAGGTPGTRIQGVLHSTPSLAFDLDFYANPACSNFPREFLEGKEYLGTAPVTTDASGTAIFDVTLNVAVEAARGSPRRRRIRPARPRSSLNGCPFR